MGQASARQTASNGSVGIDVTHFAEELLRPGVRRLASHLCDRGVCPRCGNHCLVQRAGHNVPMVTPILSSRFPKCLRFAAERRGSSAVEFALLLPLMLTMYFGSIQITDAISADRQVAMVASTVAEITSQYTTVSSTDVSNILAAASAVLTPFPVANAKVTLSSVLIDANANATIAWSATLNGTQRSGTVTAMIPSALLIPDTSVIWGEATYNYKPAIGWIITGTIPMYAQIFLRPRQSNNVVHS
jgi:Flp pilus assembly protein TadG